MVSVHTYFDPDGGGANAAITGDEAAVANAIDFIDANADVMTGGPWWASGPTASSDPRGCASTLADQISSRRTESTRVIVPGSIAETRLKVGSEVLR